MKVAYFVIRYPTVTQTFIDREMRGVAGQPGMSVEVHPILDFRFPRATDERPVPGNLPVRRVRRWPLFRAAAREAVRVLRHQPELAWRGWRTLRQHRPHTAENWFHTLWGTLYALGRAEVFRRETEPAAHFHGAWATAPATAAAVLGALCDRPWSFGAHAYDLYRDGGDALLVPKLATARFVHTTTAANVRYLTVNFPNRRAPVVLARRGLLELPAGAAVPAQAAPGRETSARAPVKRRPGGGKEGLYPPARPRRRAAPARCPLRVAHPRRRPAAAFAATRGLPARPRRLRANAGGRQADGGLGRLRLGGYFPVHRHRGRRRGTATGCRTSCRRPCRSVCPSSPVRRPASARRCGTGKRVWSWT